MITLRLAAIVAAAVTISLNAHHGFASAATLPFAVMFAALNASLDIAKCALIVAGVRAWRAKAHLIAGLSFLLFPLLFANSVWNAVSEVAINRDAAKADAVSHAERRRRSDEARNRLAREISIMQANAAFSETAACSLPRTPTSRAFCAQLKRTQNDLAAAEAAVATMTPLDPIPHITLLKAVTGHSVPALTFTLAVIPILLAELVSSFGFLIAAVHAPGAPRTPSARLAWFRRLRRRRTSKTAPESPPGPSQPIVWRVAPMP